mmetsp:Transcript_12205/g.14017  ORF Transcript_12205/g.14017 Transcript_12205/m.14017 type:complete len:108 (+) Transcript_12205:403-726(+)
MSNKYLLFVVAPDPCCCDVKLDLDIISTNELFDRDLYISPLGRVTVLTPPVSVKEELTKLEGEPVISKRPRSDDEIRCRAPALRFSLAVTTRLEGRNLVIVVFPASK